MKKILITLTLAFITTIAYAGLNYEALSSYYGKLYPTNPTPTVRDLNSLPYGKACYAYTNSVFTNGGWYVDSVPIRIFNEGTYQIGRPVPVTVTNTMTQAEREAYLLAKYGKLWAVHNEYIKMCDQLTGSTNHVVLGFDELRVILEGLAATDPNTSVLLTLKLHTLNSEGIYYGGIKWWDRCKWHDGL